MPSSTITSTSSNDAITALDQGIWSFNNWRCDAMEHIDRSIETDPGYVLAQAVKGLVLLGGRHKRFNAVIEPCLHAAKSGLSGASDYESQLTQAFDAMYHGRINDSVALMQQLLASDPTNLFVHRIVQQELFWMGEAETMRSVAESALPAWSDDHRDYGGFLSVLAFSLEESGDHARAEQFGRQAVAIDNEDCWGTHAVAHVLEMQNRTQEGIDWLKGLSRNWDNSNIIKHHLWWHLCLFLLEHKAHDEILNLVVTEVRNEDSDLVKGLPDAYIDLQNVASILLRLELRGVDVSGYWQPIAQYSAERIDNHTSPFTSAHAAMVLAASQRWEDAERLIESMQSFADDDKHDLAPRFAEAAIPAAKAALAHRRGDYQLVVDTLKPAMPELWRMGGSHAQRDVFTQLLFDACRRLQLTSELSAIVNGLSTSGFSHGSERTLYSSIH